MSLLRRGRRHGANVRPHFHPSKGIVATSSTSYTLPHHQLVDCRAVVAAAAVVVAAAFAAVCRVTSQPLCFGAIVIWRAVRGPPWLCGIDIHDIHVAVASARRCYRCRCRCRCQGRCVLIRTVPDGGGIPQQTPRPPRPQQHQEMKRSGRILNARLTDAFEGEPTPLAPFARTNTKLLDALQ